MNPAPTAPAPAALIYGFVSLATARVMTDRCSCGIVKSSKAFTAAAAAALNANGFDHS